MNKNRKKITIFLGLLMTLLVVIGTSYAMWQLPFFQEDNNLVTSGCFKITYSDNNPIDLSDVIPLSDDVGRKLTPYEFTLTNVCDTKAYYNVNLEVLNDTNIDYGNLIKIQFNAGKPEFLKNADKGITGLVIPPTLNNAVKLYRLDGGILESGMALSFTLRLWLDEDAVIDYSDSEKIFNSKVTVSTSYVGDDSDDEMVDYFFYDKIKKQAVLDNEASEFVTSSTGIDFSKAPSDTNGKGVYTIADTKDNEYPVHYFRGEVTNNNVKFANFCWKIVRTTETGGIKLIYNGVPNEAGGCTNTTGEITQIGTSKFGHDSYVDSIGYMYPETTNANSSAVKTMIDTWYQNNMTDFTSYLEDTVWCNDRSIYNPERPDAYDIYYGAFGRNDDLYKPSIECPNANDKFTVSSENGNGKLTYPVALLTADEATYAGHGYPGYSSSSYLYTNQNWWLMSPDGYIIGGGALEFGVRTGGNLRSDEVVNLGGVRPSVSLVPRTRVKTGTDGSAESPFEVVIS